MRQLSAIMDKLDNTGAAGSQLSAPERALFERFQQQAGSVTDKQIKALDDKIGRMDKVVTEGREDVAKLQKETDEAMTSGKLATAALGTIYAADATFAGMRMAGGVPEVIGRVWQGSRAAGDLLVSGKEGLTKLFGTPAAESGSAGNSQRAASRETPSQPAPGPAGPSQMPDTAPAQRPEIQQSGAASTPRSQSASGEPVGREGATQTEAGSSLTNPETVKAAVDVVSTGKILEEGAKVDSEFKNLPTVQAARQDQRDLDLYNDIKPQLARAERVALGPEVSGLHREKLALDKVVKDEREASGSTASGFEGVVRAGSAYQNTVEMLRAEREGKVDEGGIAGTKAIKDLTEIPELINKYKGGPVSSGTSGWTYAGRAASFGTAAFEISRYSEAVEKNDIHGALEHGGEALQNTLEGLGEKNAADALKGARKTADQALTYRELQESQQTFNSNIDRIRDGLDRTEERMEQDRLWRILLTRQHLRELAQQTAPR
jgi:hypothetical protein